MDRSTPYREKREKRVHGVFAACNIVYIRVTCTRSRQPSAKVSAAGRLGSRFLRSSGSFIPPFPLLPPSPLLYSFLLSSSSFSSATPPRLLSSSYQIPCAHHAVKSVSHLVAPSASPCITRVSPLDDLFRPLPSSLVGRPGHLSSRYRAP